MSKKKEVKVFIRITGTEEVLQKLEEIEKKAWELENCVRSLPTTLGIEVVDKCEVRR